MPFYLEAVVTRGTRLAQYTLEEEGKEGFDPWSISATARRFDMSTSAPDHFFVNIMKPQAGMRSWNDPPADPMLLPKLPTLLPP